LDYYVVFCGKFANWKRLDALLGAAAIYERDFKVGTLIVGSGPLADQKLYQDLAVELGLEKTFFLGPKAQPELATLFSGVCFSSVSLCLFLLSSSS
jgi:glycosyltransferase involved in cell wall biosynthesis